MCAPVAPRSELLLHPNRNCGLARARGRSRSDSHALAADAHGLGNATRCHDGSPSRELLPDSLFSTPSAHAVEHFGMVLRSSLVVGNVRPRPGQTNPGRGLRLSNTQHSIDGE